MPIRENLIRQVNDMLAADRLARLERDQLRDRIAQAETAARIETGQIRAEVIRLMGEQIQLAVQLAAADPRPAIEAPKQWQPNYGIRP